MHDIQRACTLILLNQVNVHKETLVNDYVNQIKRIR